MYQVSYVHFCVILAYSLGKKSINLKHNELNVYVHLWVK